MKRFKYSFAFIIAFAATVATSATLHADDPSFKLLNRGMYYPASRNLTFPYSSCHVTNLDITVSKCYVNNLNAYELRSHDMKRRMTKVASRHIELAPPYGEKVNRMLPLGDLIGKCEPGFYMLNIDTGVTIRHGSDWWSWREELKDDCIFAITDLGISAAVSPSKNIPMAMVLVHSLKDGKPVKGAAVTVLSHNNQVIGQGKTDKFGMAKVPFAESFKIDEDSAWGVMATKDGDISYIQLDYSSGAVSRDSYSQDLLEDVRAYLFAERDICRPGESFDTGLFLRSSPQGGMTAIGNAPVELELLDASDNRIENRRLKTDRWGFVAATWPIPAAAQIGIWTVIARMAGRELGRFSVNVSAYVPDRFRVGLKIDDVAPGSTNPPSFKGTAAYYFGENVRDAKWTITANVCLASPAPHWAGWTCGTGETPKIPSSSAKGDVEDGEFEAGYSYELFEKCMESKSPLRIDVEATVTPPGARTVTASSSVRIDASDRYIGIRDGATKIRDVRAFDLAFLPARGTSGTLPITNVQDEITVKIVKNEWKCHAVEKGDGTFRMEWREEKTELPNLTREMKPGTLEYLSSALASGNYTMIATTADGLETHFNFWHWEGEVSERSVSPAALNLKSDKDKALPGDTVKLTFNSSHIGLAYFAAGERGMETTGTFAVKKGVNSFTVPIRKDAASKYTYVVVTVINENAPNARRLSGMARINVTHLDRKYPLSMELPETVRPGETVNVKVKSDGAGAVRLMAVDEGVLALTGYSSPDIFTALYNYDFGCPISLNDLYSLIYPDLKILPNGQIGGGGFVETMKRKNVRTRRDSTRKQKDTARVVLPLAEIPASGETTVRMKMPDFTGAMRVMAVAVDERRAGAATGEVIVRDVASLFLNAPRCAVGGDAYELTAEVFNHDLPESDWTLEVLGRKFAGRLGKGASTNIVFTVSIPADAAGVQEIRGALKIGGETFKDVAFLTVRPKNPPIIETAYSVRRADEPKPEIEPTANEWERLDEDKTEECGTPKSAIAGALKWLEDYPYGCLEQTTAAAFPFLSADDLLRLGVIDEAARSNSVVKVKAAYGEIMQMALSDGSFSMWPGGKDPWIDGTLFALHFIFAAERQGWIKPDPRGKMIGWLKKTVNENDPKTRLNRAYASYILALAGENTFANAAKNILATKEIDFASFLASAALVHGGYASDGMLDYNAAVAARVWEKGAIQDSDGWSRTRAYGMALMIIGMSPAGTTGSDVAPLVVRLIESLRGDGSAWGTTRDNAWACAGLARFSQKDLVFSCRMRSGIPKAMPVHSDVLRVSRPFPERVKKGELIDVEISINSPQHIRRAVLCDLVPGGFELEDSSLVTRAKDGADNSGRSEIRDDRWLWFGTIPENMAEKPMKLRYRLRAVTRGTFTVPTLSVEHMYNPDVAGIVETEHMVVVE